MAANNQNFRVKYGLDVTENLNVTGDLTVNGAIQLSNSVTIENLTVTGNAEITAALSTQNTSLVFSDGLTLSDPPGSNVSVTVNRGSSANVELSWNEVNDRWEFTNDGSSRYPLKTYDDNYSFTFDNSVTDTDSDPGDNTIIFNSANNAAANVIAVDNKIVGGANVAAFLATLDDGNSDPAGTIVIKDIDDTTKTQSFTYSTVVANTGFVQFTGVSCIETANVAYANGNTLALNFIRYGDKGQKGEKGQKGQKGELGQKGEQINSASFDDGTNTTTFTNSDASTFNIVGLKGQKGEKGQKGQKGELGQKGDKGDTALTGNTVVTAFAESNTSFGTHNAIMNGNFEYWQRGTSIDNVFSNDDFAINSDTEYVCDRWKLISDGNNIVDLGRETTNTPTYTHGKEQYAFRFDVETTGSKFGIIQYIERQNCQDIIEAGVATLSFKAKTSDATTIDNVKAAIISWYGGTNGLSNDPISAWNADATNPTLNTNFNYENSPVNLNISDSEFTDVTITASFADPSPSTIQNLAVMIWCDISDANVGDFLYISNVQLEKGSVATPFVRPDPALKAVQMQRYYAKTDADIDMQLICAAAADSVFGGAVFTNAIMPNVRGSTARWIRKGSGTGTRNTTFVLDIVPDNNSHLGRSGGYTVNSFAVGQASPEGISRLRYNMSYGHTKTVVSGGNRVNQVSDGGSHPYGKIEWLGEL